MKILEEPNDNINFILINNNKKVLPTLKSRCLNFKVSLTHIQSIKIINKILKEDYSNFLNDDFVTHYSTPGKIIEIINFANVNNFDVKNLSLKEFISKIIIEKKYKQETSIKELLFSLIEIYFRNNISIKKIELIDMFNYFLKKINDTKTFNLDEESLFMEFEDRVLNG